MCTFIHSSGILILYLLGQLVIWFASHFTILFLKLVFPFHVPSTQKIKYIYIAYVIMGIVLPLFPIVTSVTASGVKYQNLSDNSTSTLTFFSEGLGFMSPRFPYILCLATSIESLFYTFVIPIYIISGFGCTIFLIIIWSLLKLKKMTTAQVS